jgi:Tol biopolymer transport system component
VKVLDFGLAKALENSPMTTTLSNSPTLVSGTVGGVILGTASYMSPEQARGKEVDAGTDIWAFGCVLYEMLTGRQAFEGETVADIIAKIVSGFPDWARLPANTPSRIRVLLDLTLSKDRKRRLQHVGDVRPFLDAEVFPQQERRSATQDRTNRRRWIAAVAMGTLLIAALVAAVLFFRAAPAPPVAIRFEMPVAAAVVGLAVSADGQRVAYVAPTNGALRAVWVQAVGSVTARPLSGTENGASPFWSPDGRYLAFFAEGLLKKIDVSTGSVQRVCDAVGVINAQGAWSREDVILFSTVLDGGTRVSGRQVILARVSASGGAVTPVTDPSNLSGKELFHIQPHFLSDNRHFLFNAGDAPGPSPKFSVYLGSLDSKTTTRLMGSENFFRGFSSGYLLVSRNGTLIAQRFDENRYTLVGKESVVAEGVGQVGLSQAGILVYDKNVGQAANQPRNKLEWLDRTGKPMGEAAPVGTYQTPSVSRDGRKLAVASHGSAGPTSWDVWIIDLATLVSSQLTFEPGINTVPIWSPDGSKIVFASDRGENKFNAPRQIYQKLSNGSGVEQLLLEPGPGNLAFPEDWSPDGQNILFIREPTPTSTEFWLLPLAGDKKPYPYLKSTSRMVHAQFSPDGRWIAYTSEESGMPNVFVQSFPDPQGKWRVSLKGGGEPRWRRDGRELFYLALDGTLMVVPVNADPTFANGAAIPLFPTPLTVRSGGSPAFRYDVAPDGQRFLIISPAPAPAASTTSVSNPLNVVINWTAALPK